MNEKMKEVWAVMATVVAGLFLIIWLIGLMHISDLKIEAVERGYAEYTDGVWGWRDE